MKIKYFSFNFPVIVKILLLFILPSSIVFSQEIWTSTDSINAPAARWIPVAVWTGTKMIVWGGRSENPPYNTGGSYDPVNNNWTPTSTINAPPGAYWHTAVWTGNKMIVWGGTGNPNKLNTGGIYNPISDTWILTSTINAPSSRENHTAVWTGSKMIIWGGLHNTCENTGGIYDPVSDTWTSTSTINAPSPRYSHTAVWTGSKMIVWGGFSCSGYLNTGGIYDPSSDTWVQTSMTNVPAPRYAQTAVWTGNKMIIWGGAINAGSNTLKTGGIYDVATNTWAATDTINAPSGRIFHTAVWSGNKMIVWGGLVNADVNTGGIYDPINNVWSSTTTLNAPAARSYHVSVWTGTKMIIWGGAILNSGGVYSNPAVIGITKIGLTIPIIFSLSQNYPNPFNPTTQIEFNVPQNNTFVKVSVYNSTGQEVATLVNQDLNSGTYKVDFNGDKYSSGIYFYKLEAGDFTQTKKMILIK